MIKNLSETQVAYLAGLIDGEGSLESQRQMQRHGKTPRFVLRISFVFATEEPLRTISGWLGMEPKCYPATDPTRSPRWRASIPKSAAVALLARCLPHLLLKRQQAELILAIEAVRAEHSPSRQHVGTAAFSAVPRVAVQKMERLHTRLRALKSNKRRVSSR